MNMLWFILLLLTLIGNGVGIWRRWRGSSRQQSWHERLSRLQWRMAFLYIWITIASVLIFSLLLGPGSSFFILVIVVGSGVFWLSSGPKALWPGVREYARQVVAKLLSSPLWLALVLVILVFVVFDVLGVVLNQTLFADLPFSPTPNRNLVSQAALQYAQSIALQAEDKTLGEAFPYPLGDPLTVRPETYTDSMANSFLATGRVPYLAKGYPADQPMTFALLIAPDRHILSSSYPARYPIGKQTTQLLSAQDAGIEQALQGHIREGTLTDADGILYYALAPIKDQQGRTLGTIYVQVPLATLQAAARPDTIVASALSSLTNSLFATLVLLLLLTPLGGVFGFFSTYTLVRRLKLLAEATTEVANGNYQQRLPVAWKDEIGQVEQQFNRMAEQLSESMSREKALAEENARLSERSRFSRELHDAISQDLFSLSLLAGGLQNALPADSPLQQQVRMVEQTTNHTIREMRALLLELRPTRLTPAGLADTLAELATAYSTRLGLSIKTDLTAIPLEAWKEQTLLRIAQEALTNAVRHASASELTITLAMQDRALFFAVCDNGRGFQADTESHGLGLRIIEERVQEMQGTFRLESAPEQGTRLEIHIPLEEER